VRGDHDQRRERAVAVRHERFAYRKCTTNPVRI
jgi:hypothetical protein